MSSLCNHSRLRPWTSQDGYEGNLRPRRLILGIEPELAPGQERRGIQLEVRIACSPGKPTKSDIKNLWTACWNKRPAPVFLVVFYQSNDGQELAAICGSRNPRIDEVDTEDESEGITTSTDTTDGCPVEQTSGGSKKGIPDTELVVGLDLSVSRVDSIAERALELDSHHRAAEMLDGILGAIEQGLDGYRNRGLFAQHIFESQLMKPEVKDQWTDEYTGFEEGSGAEILERLGFAVTVPEDGTSLLKPKGQESARAVAVFLDRDEHWDRKREHSDHSPVAQALLKADHNELNYVIAVQQRTIRMYLAQLDRGLGRGGRNNTYFEVDLDLLPPELLWIVPMVFSSETLRPTLEGRLNIAELLDRSKRFATDLGVELRKRVFEQVLPGLAQIVAKDHQPREGETREGMDRLFQTAMTVLFRLLFVAYAEDQDLLSYEWNDLYRAQSLKAYAEHLAKEATKAGTMEIDFDQESDSTWQRLLLLWKTIHNGDDDLGIPFYNGGMFSSGETDTDLNDDREGSRDDSIGADIANLKVTNSEIGPVLMQLLVDTLPHGGYGPIDFRQLDTEEFGTIYEGLLEWELIKADTNLTKTKKGGVVPAKDDDSVDYVEGEVFLMRQSGIRKSTGTYFTPSFAVEHLLDKALEPAIDDHLERVQKVFSAEGDAAASKAFFDFKVADIAMGSGHFLVAAIDHIEKQFSQFLVEHRLEGVSAKLDHLLDLAKDGLGSLVVHYELDQGAILRRMIVRHCLYGVDIYPLAVDLAKFALWLNSFVPGLPLSFLDHNLICGNSLIGIGTREELLEDLMSTKKIRVPDNEANRKLVQEAITDPLFREWIGQVTTVLQIIIESEDTDISEIASTRSAHDKTILAARNLTQLSNILMSQRLSGFPKFVDISDKIIQQYPKSDEVDKLSRELTPIHFMVSFPEVFLRNRSGFDCVIGNPPWEKVKLERRNWWALRFPGTIRGLSKKRADPIIDELESQYPSLKEEYMVAEKQTLRMAELIKGSVYHRQSSGDTDMYQAFGWRFIQLTSNNNGRIGVVMPGASLVGAGTVDWRKNIITVGGINDITRIKNELGWFHNGISANIMLCLISIVIGKNLNNINLQGPFYNNRDFEKYVNAAGGGGGGRSNEYEATIIQTSSIKNWTTDLFIPVLRNSRFHAIFDKLHKHPQFGTIFDPWQARPVCEMHSTNDNDKMLSLNVQINDEIWPVYGGKSFNFWDPDTGEYFAMADKNVVLQWMTDKRGRQRNFKNSAFSELDQGFQAKLPPESPRIAFRDTARSTDPRTMIAALVPREIFLSGSSPYLFFRKGDNKEVTYVLGILSSMPFDWASRRIVDLGFKFGKLNSLPIPNPSPSNTLKQEIIKLAGLLSTHKDANGFAEWALSIDVERRNLKPDEIFELSCQLDAHVAKLYGLDRDDLAYIYETFHHENKHEKRAAKALEYFDALS